MAGNRLAGGKKLRFKDNLKTTMKLCGINTAKFEKIAEDRSLWKTMCRWAATSKFEDKSVGRYKKETSKENCTCISNNVNPVFM